MNLHWDSQMVGFMSLSPLNLKTNGVCLRQLRTGRLAVWQQHLQPELQDQSKPSDDEMTDRAEHKSAIKNYDLRTPHKDVD
ncbi:hypothetical protein V6N13_119647 [Hibiscus sabdariffa]